MSGIIRFITRLLPPPNCFAAIKLQLEFISVSDGDDSDDSELKRFFMDIGVVNNVKRKKKVL